jgi:mannose-6-phosphate isomerase-like protein (cupin superfamily)
MMTTDGVSVVDATEGPALPIVEGDGRAWAVVWPGMGAELRSLHRIVLGVGSRTVELSHPSDAVYYVVTGHGVVAEPAGAPGEPLREGAMFHVDAGTAYVIAAGEDGIELMGGPAPADPSLYDLPSREGA